jgi:multiple sugar transport system substrate-binding protein
MNRRRLARASAVPGILMAVAVAVAAACSRSSASKPLRMWAFGREGEVVQQLIPEFTRRYPGVRVEVQQIPWTAAHEKLLTAFVGSSLPDVAPIGNTWVPEFEAVHALEPLDARAAASPVASGADDFPGIWATNVVDKKLWGIPWYVDTRVLFYRRDLLERAGFREPPRTWAAWRGAMDAISKLTLSGRRRYAILLPTDEWAQPVILGLEKGASLLAEGGRRGAFRQPAFQEAAKFYVDLFRGGLAPVVSWGEIGNVYQEFGRGDITMWITGPWNIGEFRRRPEGPPPGSWSTAPMPGAGDGPGEYPGVSIAGGSSLVVFRSSRRKDDAWKLVEYLSEPAQQALFYKLVGDLPARKSAWNDPALASDEIVAAFRVQLDHVAPLPQVPEWEQIATRLFEQLEPAIRGRTTVPAALAALDADVDRMLEKRRWMLGRAAARGSGDRVIGRSGDLRPSTSWGPVPR